MAKGMACATFPILCFCMSFSLVCSARLHPAKTDHGSSFDQLLDAAAPSCTVVKGSNKGDSDGGSVVHACADCARTCTQANKQKAIYVNYDFDPPLKDANLFDATWSVEFTNMKRMQEYDGQRGIFHAAMLKFGTFGGYVGPQIIRKGYLRIQHVFSIWDSKKAGLFAVPATGFGGCARNCNDCGSKHSADLGTGTQCKLQKHGTETGESFVYRLRMSKDAASAEWNGATYSGTEWEATVEDLLTQQVQVLGRIIFQGDTGNHGIKSFRHFHEHIGCTPCDAFYESTTFTPPQASKPSKTKLAGATYAPIKATDTCRRFRVFALGSDGKMMIETGPGISEAMPDEQRKLLACP